MSVRLLPRSEVEKRKTEERRQEIDEGMKVAARVDVLRETVAKEEALFDTWQKETLVAIQGEINDKVIERDSLKVEIQKLDAQQKELLKPLNKRWEEVDALKEGLEAKTAGILQKEADLQKALSLNIQRERENKSEEERIINIKNRTSGELIMAQRDRELAQKELNEERERSFILNAALALREREVSQKEKDAENMIYKANEQVRNIEKYEIDLAKREATLRAGWKNLERTKQKLS